jgi:site-specific DNA-methyltransferase (adenine-specific)
MKMYKFVDIVGSIVEGDCLDVMASLPDASVSMVLCDLPYGTTQNPWDSVIDLNRLWLEYERIIKPNGSVLLFSQGKFTAQLISSKYSMFKYKIVWVKSKATNWLNVNRQPLRRHEDICVFYKRQPVYNPEMTTSAPYNKGTRKAQQSGSYGDFSPVEVKSEGSRHPTDVVYFKTAESEGKVFHPTQKPVELARYLIRTYSEPGDLVLDNACGSGTFPLAAAMENRQFIGIELNEDGARFKESSIDWLSICSSRFESAGFKLSLHRRS